MYGNSQLNDEIIRNCVTNVIAFHSTAAQLKGLMPILALSPLEVMEKVERCDVFQPQGLVRLAKYLGLTGTPLEELEVRLGLRKPAKQG